jgi:hypothetical protein
VEVARGRGGIARTGGGGGGDSDSAAREGARERWASGGRCSDGTFSAIPFSI